MQIGDLDGVPGDEILLQTPTELTAWKFGGTAPLWRIPLSGPQNVLLAQLDDDPQLEIVLSSGTVIDSKTLQTEWRYPIGFGPVMVSADVNGDGVDELIGCTGRHCDAFDVRQKTTMWEMFLPYQDEAGALAAADIDGSGKATLFEGDSQHGYIRKIDGMTGTVLQQFSKVGDANFIIVGDLAGDCRKEVIWAKDGGNTAIDTFYLTDSLTMQTFWSSIPEDMGSSGVAVADFAGNGHPSVLWTSIAGSVERFAGFNPAATSSRFRSGAYDGYALYLGVTAAAKFDSKRGADYVLPFSSSPLPPADIAVYNGATREIAWTVSVVPQGDTISAISTGDVNGDGVPDIVVGTGILYFPSNHFAFVAAIDGATHKTLWSTKDQLSHALDTSCFGCVYEVRAADLKLDGSKQVLALVPSDGLYAFDGRTGSTLWHSTLGFADPLDTGTAFAFAVADIDPSPGQEIIAPLVDGRLAVFDSSASKIIRTKDLSKFGVAVAIDVADLDGDGVSEIVLSTEGGLVVLASQTLDVLWSGGFLLPDFNRGNQIAIADVDGDGTKEIVVPSAHSLRVFEYRPNVSDTLPPVFVNAAIRLDSAAAGCCRVAFDWDAASDAASMPVRYRIYRSLIPAFAPDRSSRIAETAATEFADRLLLQGHTYFYAVTAVDTAGNESAPLRISAPAPDGCPVKRRAAGKP